MRGGAGGERTAFDALGVLDCRQHLQLALRELGDFDEAGGARPLPADDELAGFGDPLGLVRRVVEAAGQVLHDLRSLDGVHYLNYFKLLNTIMPSQQVSFGGSAGSTLAKLSTQSSTLLKRLNPLPFLPQCRRLSLPEIRSWCRGNSPDGLLATHRPISRSIFLLSSNTAQLFLARLPKLCRQISYLECRSWALSSGRCAVRWRRGYFF